MDLCRNTSLKDSLSNSTSWEDAGPLLADLYIIITGCVIFFSIFPIFLFQSRCCPIGSTTVVLISCVLLVAFQVIPQQEVYEIITRKENVQLVLIMMGITLIAHLIDRDKLIERLLKKCIKAHQCFELYLFAVCVTSFIASATLSNDATSRILTNSVLKIWEGQERNRQELNVLLLGISTTANIASVSSLFGSPAMALIAVKTHLLEFSKSRLDLRLCIMFLLPTAVIAFFINYTLLIIYYHIRHKYSRRTKLICEPSRSQEMAGLTNDYCKTNNSNGYINHDASEDGLHGCVLHDERVSQPCQLETIPEDDVLVIQNSPSLENHDMDLRYIDDTSSNSSSDSDEDAPMPHSTQIFSNRAFNIENRLAGSPTLRRSNNISVNMNLHLTGDDYDLDSILKESGLRVYRKLGVYRSLAALSFVLLLENGKSDLGDKPNKRRSGIAFDVLLCMLVTGIVGCYLAAALGINLDLGLTVFAAVTLALSLDSILNRKCSMGILRRLDCSVIILWFGVFIWMEGLNKTGLPQYLWHLGGLTISDFSSVSHISILFAITMVPSIAVGNNTMAMICLMLLVPCADQLPFVLLLAWLLAMAGNLTLFSSVTNISVARESIRATRHKFSYWAHLQYAFPTTLALAILGIVIICGLLQLH